MRRSRSATRKESPSDLKKKALLVLQQDMDVASIQRNSVEFHYKHEGLVIKSRIDFLVKRKTQPDLAIMIVPENYLESPSFCAKINSVEQKANKMGAEFEVWSEGFLVRNSIIRNVRYFVA